VSSSVAFTIFVPTIFLGWIKHDRDNFSNLKRIEQAKAIVLLVVLLYKRRYTKTQRSIE
jgi:hypothetical protein